MNPLLTAWALLAVFGGRPAAAPARLQASRTTRTEARNEIPVPSFSGKLHQAHRITSALSQLLRLDPAQQATLEACAVAECRAQALALTAAEVAQAQRTYLASVRHVLAVAEAGRYVALYQQATGTHLPGAEDELNPR